MDGKVLVNAFEEEQTVAYTDSWDQIPGEDGRHPEGATADAAGSAEGLRQLVDLGYIDAPDGDRAQAVDDTLRELQYNLGQAYFDGGRIGEAAAIFEKLWTRYPRESRFGTKLLSCWLALEDASLARATFDRLLERKRDASQSAAPELASLIRELKEKNGVDPEANDEESRKKWMASLDPATSLKLRRLQGQAGANPHAIAFLSGSVLALEKRYEEALRELEKAANVQTANRPSLLNRMGEIHLKTGNDEEAERCFTEMLSLSENSPDARMGLARVFFRRKNYFHSAAEALASLELVFHQPRAHTLYGTSLLRLGMARMGEKALLTAISQNPDYAPAHEELARAYSRRKLLKDPEKAALHRQAAADARKRIAEMRVGLDRAPDSELVVEFPRIANIRSKLDPGTGHPLIVVSGLPRSGTSLMMQMLAAGGIPIVTDRARKADDSNPKGYFEDDRVKRLAKDSDRSWLADHKGSAIKIVAPLLPFIPEDLPTLVIFMERPSKEIIESQKIMLNREGKTGAFANDAELSRIFAGHLSTVNALPGIRPKMEILSVRYHDLLRNPQRTAEEIADFLGRTLDQEAMAKVPDRSLHRSRGKVH